MNGTWFSRFFEPFGIPANEFDEVLVSVRDYIRGKLVRVAKSLEIDLDWPPK